MSKKNTVLIACTCKHEFQDQTYGKQKRIANVTAKGDISNKEVRCTVCKSTQKVKVD